MLQNEAFFYESVTYFIFHSGTNIWNLLCHNSNIVVDLVYGPSTTENKEGLNSSIQCTLSNVRPKATEPPLPTFVATKYGISLTNRINKFGYEIR